MFLVDVSGGITILTWQPNPMTVTGRHGSVTGPSRVRHVVVRVGLIACVAVSAEHVHENEPMGTTHDRHGSSRVRHGSVTGLSRVRHVVVRVGLIACVAVSAEHVHENELMGTTHDRHGPSRVRHGSVTGSSRVGLVSVMTKRVCHIVSIAYGR